MSLYFARYKGMPWSSMGIVPGDKRYIEVRQDWILKGIKVKIDGKAGTINYPGLELFLTDWDNFEIEATDKEMIPDSLKNMMVAGI